MLAGVDYAQVDLGVLACQVDERRRFDDLGAGAKNQCYVHHFSPFNVNCMVSLNNSYMASFLTLDGNGYVS